ncbi:MAG: hypothetical protein ACE5GQ_05740 [Nitrospinales bacterium]
MPSLKGMLFSKFANEGLSALVEEMQKKHKPKKGRRFNHNDITYEIGKPAFKDNALEFEISCKIPQDEVKNAKAVKSYVSEVKKILNKEKNKPVAVELENIVWDSKTELEKERDYLKFLYQYPLDDLYDNKDLLKRHEAIVSGSSKEKVPQVPGVFTLQGKIVLMMVRESVQQIGRKHVEGLINAITKVRQHAQN